MLVSPQYVSQVRFLELTKADISSFTVTHGMTYVSKIIFAAHYLLWFDTSGSYPHHLALSRTNFWNDWATEVYEMSKADVVRFEFEMNSWSISHITTAPELSMPDFLFCSHPWPRGNMFNMISMYTLRPGQMAINRRFISFNKNNSIFSSMKRDPNGSTKN